MSLKDLNTLEAEAKFLDSQHERTTRAADLLKSVRTQEGGFDQVLKRLAKGAYGSDLASAELFAVLKESQGDLIRLAELRLIAKARDQKIKAAQRRAVLAACILPLPAIEG